MIPSSNIDIDLFDIVARVLQWDTLSPVEYKIQKG